MSILRNAIENLRNVTGIDMSNDFENIVFDLERLFELLKSSKPVNRQDKEILISALNIIEMLATNNY